MLSDGPAVLSDSSLVIKNDSCLSVVDIWSGETTFALFVMNGFGGGNNSRQYLAVFRQNKQEDYPPALTVHEWILFGITKVGDDHASQRFFSEISCQDNQIT